MALDVFREFQYPKDRNEQTAWLSLLATENLEDAKELISEYPWLEEIYQEMAMLRQKPEEVLWMFSEALRILDANTARYMIEELQKDLEQEQEALQQKEAEILALKEQLELLKNKGESI